MLGSAASDAWLSLTVSEWKKLDEKGKLKQPHAIAMTNDAQMVMAGLWAKWKSPTSDEEILSCTILTGGPNHAMGELHDRMPVILAEIDWPTHHLYIRRDAGDDGDEFVGVEPLPARPTRRAARARADQRTRGRCSINTGAACRCCRGRSRRSDGLLTAGRLGWRHRRTGL